MKLTREQKAFLIEKRWKASRKKRMIDDLVLITCSGLIIVLLVAMAQEIGV